MSNHDLNELPFIDRELTKWKLYAYKNGNFKYHPGSYTMIGRDCWWRSNGGCTFCSWPTLYPVYRIRKPELLIEEIGHLISKYRIKDIFDDTGTFPVGNWLKKFCNLMIDHGYNKKVNISCNMRFGILKDHDYSLMKKAGFRMLLYGVESANQRTLDLLNKGVQTTDISAGCKMASSAGLEPHITIMIGYPWERREEALNTLQFAKMLMNKGWVKTLQSTIIVPYPGTKLYSESLKNDWFRVNPNRYEKYDMRVPILKTPEMSPDEVIKLCDEVYKVFLSPSYFLRYLLSIRSFKDLNYIYNGFFKVLGHMRDFSNENNE